MAQFSILGQQDTRVAKATYQGPLARSINLLIIQPSPFCNIDCDYCYLPERATTSRIEPTLITSLLTDVFDCGLVDKQLSVVWHAGEPLALPISFYKTVFEKIDSLHLPIKPDYSIQTNALLLNHDWCDFISANDIKIGVSLDGPAFIHDLHRKDRMKKGTHKRVMEGISHLKTAQIPFHVIAVISSASLDHPDEIYSFFVDNGIRDVGFNIEELEGAHKNSTFTANFSLSRVRRFFSRLFELQSDSRGALRIREFDRAYRSIARNPIDRSSKSDHSDLTVPFGIVSMDWQGNLSTFSPELLGMTHHSYGALNFGNIKDGSVKSILRHPRFAIVAQDIEIGVQACENHCQYFFLCGGGAPSNKLYENDSFRSTETIHCKSTIQIPVEVVLTDLERSLSS